MVKHRFSDPNGATPEQEQKRHMYYTALQKLSTCSAGLIGGGVDPLFEILRARIGEIRAGNGGASAKMTNPEQRALQKWVEDTHQAILTINHIAAGVLDTKWAKNENGDVTVDARKVGEADTPPDDPGVITP